MRSILFLRRDGVYLPEINAYIKYLETNHKYVKGIDSASLGKKIKLNDFDVVWKFMGIDWNKENHPNIIHEYGSLSVGRIPLLKNIIKKTVNATPSRRVFLNTAVRDGLGFTDNRPYCLRDMGVDPQFFRAQSNPSPQYDFVYSGSLNRKKSICAMMRHFKESSKARSLLVIGTVPDDIFKEYGHTQNIHFTGRVKYEQVPDILYQARYGLNIVPDIYPFNIQTSTKILEYCASKMPVVSTNYAWVRQFERIVGGKFYFLRDGFSSFSSDNLETFNFVIPSVKDRLWDTIIKKSGVFDFLLSSGSVNG